MYIKELSNMRGLATLWYICGNYYIVSSVNGLGLSETMIFEANKEGEVINWAEVYVTDYSANHQQVIDEWVNQNR